MTGRFLRASGFGSQRAFPRFSPRRNRRKAWSIRTGPMRSQTDSLKDLAALSLSETAVATVWHYRSWWSPPAQRRRNVARLLAVLGSLLAFPLIRWLDR